MDRILTKIFYIVFQVLKVLLIKICKIHTVTRSFIFCCFYQLLRQQISFSQVFRTSFNIIWKKDFCYKFSFFNGFTQIMVFQHYYAMMTLGRTRTTEQNQYFNPTLIPGSMSSYKPLDWGQPKTFMVGKLLQELLDAAFTLVNGQNIFCSRWENALSD